MINEPPPKQIRSWTDAEHNAAAWMRYWGFTDAQVTAGGSDGGVDVRSSDGLAQVKYEARQVGRPQLQNLVGARGRAHEQKLLFFSGAGFSARAVDYAADMDIALFEYSLDGSMRAQNGTARQLSREARFQKDSPQVDRSDRVIAWQATQTQRAAVGYSREAKPPSKRSRWVHLGLAVFFWWGILAGLFREENYQTVDGVLGGLAILLLALLFSWLARRAFRRYAESRSTQP